MGSINLTATGAAAPFFPNDWSLEDISAADFDPITTLFDADNVNPNTMPIPRMVAKYERKGFLIRPNADGDVYAVSKARYDDACKAGMTLAQKRVALAALTAQKFNGLAGQWIEIPVVKVVSATTTATEIEVGIIL